MRSKAKICHISTLHQPNDNRIFHRYCCSLAKNGYEVHFLVPDHGANRVAKGVRIHTLKPTGNRLRRMMIMPWRAMKEALKLNADIYHYHDPEFIIAGFLMAFVLKKKVVFDVHESVHLQIQGKDWIPKWFRKIVSFSYKSIEMLLTCNQEIIVANRLCMGDYPKTIHLVQNYPVLLKNSASLFSAGKFDEKPLLVYVGGVSDVRGADIYIELAGRLYRKGYDFHMKIIGWNCFNTVERLRPRIKELGIEKMVEFTGEMDWLEAMASISRAHIGLCLLRPIPNYVTCLATKIIEYMMLGIPVLASNFDAWRPYVEKERTGYMADPQNIDEITAKCEMLLNDKHGLMEMAERGRRAVQNKYNWDMEYKQVIRCYNRMLGVQDF